MLFLLLCMSACKGQSYTDFRDVSLHNILHLNLNYIGVYEKVVKRKITNRDSIAFIMNRIYKSPKHKELLPRTNINQGFIDIEVIDKFGNSHLNSVNFTCFDGEIYGVGFNIEFREVKGLYDYLVDKSQVLNPDHCPALIRKYGYD